MTGAERQAKWRAKNKTAQKEQLRTLAVSAAKTQKELQREAAALREEVRTLKGTIRNAEGARVEELKLAWMHGLIEMLNFVDDKKFARAVHNFYLKRADIEAQWEHYEFCVNSPQTDVISYSLQRFDTLG
jgi:DNA anti-recombination protein RmuC